MKKTMLTIAFGLVVGLVTGMQTYAAKISQNYTELFLTAANSFGAKLDPNSFAQWNLIINTLPSTLLANNNYGGGALLGASQGASLTANKNVKGVGKFLALALASAEDDQEKQGLSAIATIITCLLDANGDNTLMTSFKAGFNSASNVDLQFVELDDVIGSTGAATTE